MNLAQIRAARARDYRPARVGGGGVYDIDCIHAASGPEGAADEAAKIKAKIMAAIAANINTNLPGEWENYGLRPGQTDAWNSPLAHRKMYIDLTGDIRAKLTDGILFKLLNDLGLDGEVSCYGIGKKNVAIEIINSMSRHGASDYITWPEYLNALFKVGPASNDKSPDPTKPVKPVKSGEPAKPGEPAPVMEEPVEYLDMSDLDKVSASYASHGLRHVLDFIIREQFEASEDNIKWVFNEYGKDGCLDRMTLATMISLEKSAKSAARVEGTRVAGTIGDVWGAVKKIPSGAKSLVWSGSPSFEVGYALIAPEDSLPEADEILSKFDLDKDGCLNLSEYLAALKTIEKPRKIRILEAPGLRPIFQSEQVRPPPKPFKFEQVAGMSTATKAGLAVGAPVVMGGLLALKYGWLGFATGGVLGLAGVGAAAWTIHRVKTRTEIKGKQIDKKLVDLKDVKEQPMADNLVTSKSPEMTPEIYPLHMNILAGQLEAAGYLKAAKQASALAAGPKVSGPPGLPNANPEPTSQIVPGTPRQAPPPTASAKPPSGAMSPTQVIRVEAVPTMMSAPQVKRGVPILLVAPEPTYQVRDRRGRQYTTSMPKPVSTSLTTPRQKPVSTSLRSLTTPVPKPVSTYLIYDPATDVWTWPVPGHYTTSVPKPVSTSLSKMPWPVHGSICEDAINKLPPDVKRILVDPAIASPGIEELRRVASILKDPYYEDRYKFVAGCLNARADSIARGKS